MSNMRAYVQRWLNGERAYATNKWPDETAKSLIEQSEITEWVLMYVHRAETLGVQTVNGRQALAKALMTLHRLTELTCDLYGPLPAPGLPSGEIQPFRTPYNV